MVERNKTITRWWNKTPDTGPDDAGNVVQMPQPDWSEIEAEIIAATNDVVHWEAEAAKVEAGYKRAVERLSGARARWNDRTINRIGGKTEFLAHPREME